MLITKTAEIVKIATKSGGKDEPWLIVQLAIPLDHINPAERGELLGYQDHDVSVTFKAAPLPDPNHKPMDDLWNTDQKPIENAVPERMRPLGDERCAVCGRVIGEDFTADFLTPLAGQPRPVHGVCKDQAERDHAERECQAGGVVNSTLADQGNEGSAQTGESLAAEAAVDLDDPPQEHGDDEGSQEPRRGRGAARVLRK